MPLSSQIVATPSIASQHWRGLYDVVWQATAKQRHELHRTANQFRCTQANAPYAESRSVTVSESASRAPAQPNPKFVVDCAGVGCLDFYHDVLVVAYDKLEGLSARAQDWDRYLYRTVANVVADHKRTQRAKLGLPARPSRLDGRVGLVIEQIESEFPDQAEWLGCLFQMMREHVCRLGRTTTTWPLETWVGDQVKHGATPKDQEQDPLRSLSRDIERVTQIARKLLGQEWVYTNLTGALHQWSATSELESTELGAKAGAVAPDHESTLMSKALFNEYARARLAGRSSRQSVLAAANKVVGETALVWNSEIAALTRLLDRELKLL
jgi:hypothetical protein